MKPDLTLLYSQLGLRPDCSLAELQLAYRRRISELQPDRLEPGSQSPESSALLRNLIWLYTSASRFHRRYGRLPGAAPNGAPAGGSPGANIQRTRMAHGPARSDNPQRTPSRVALGLSIFLTILLLAVLVLADWSSL
jgi:hypothetical protein